MASANTVGSRLSVNLKTKAISQTVKMPSPRTSTRRNTRFSNLTIRYRATIRLRVENLPDRISDYEDHGISVVELAAVADLRRRRMSALGQKRSFL